MAYKTSENNLVFDLGYRTKSSVILISILLLAYANLITASIFHFLIENPNALDSFSFFYFLIVLIVVIVVHVILSAMRKSGDKVLVYLSKPGSEKSATYNVIYLNDSVAIGEIGNNNLFLWLDEGSNQHLNNTIKGSLVLSIKNKPIGIESDFNDERGFELLIFDKPERAIVEIINVYKYLDLPEQTIPVAYQLKNQKQAEKIIYHLQNKFQLQLSVL